MHIHTFKTTPCHPWKETECPCFSDMLHRSDVQFCTPKVGFRIAHVNHVLWLSFPQHYRPFHTTTACSNRKENMYLAKWCMKNKVNIMLCFPLHTFIYVEGILQERIKNTEHSSLGADCTLFWCREYGNQHEHSGCAWGLRWTTTGVICEEEVTHADDTRICDFQRNFIG